MAGKIQTAAANKQQVLKQGAQPTMQSYIKTMKGEIEKALPTVMTPDRFTRIVMTAISSNPKLAETTPSSFLGAMMTAAQLGVEPNTPLGQAYLIPFFNSKKGVLECQFQLGYKGLIDLAYRSGQVSLIQAHVVYENDEFEFELGLDPKLKHIPTRGTKKGDPIWVYGMFKTKDGGYGFEVMSVEDVREIEKANRKGNNGMSNIWVKHFDAMAKKTVLKQALKYAPMKSEFLRGIALDESIKNEVAADMNEVPTEYIEPEYQIDEDGVIQDDPNSNELTEAEKQQILEAEAKEAANE
jgi:recombination protein RecT